MKTYERRYHCNWTHGRSPLATLGRWLHEHPGRLPHAPADLLTSALRDVSDRLPGVAAREPTRRHRKHFYWLLGWHDRIASAIARVPA